MQRQLKVIPETEMTPELDAVIRMGLCICFPDDAAIFSVTRTWHGSGPTWTALVIENGRVLAHAGTVARKIRVGERQLNVAGIQSGFVLPECRCTGLGNDVMKATMEEAERRKTDYGLLFCVPGLERLYARMGWRTLRDVAVTRVAEGKKCPIPGKNIVMFYPIVSPEFPAGPIHLQGNDW